MGEQALIDRAMSVYVIKESFETIDPMGVLVGRHGVMGIGRVLNQAIDQGPCGVRQAIRLAAIMEVERRAVDAGVSANILDGKCFQIAGLEQI